MRTFSKFIFFLTKFKNLSPVKYIKDKVKYQSLFNEFEKDFKKFQALSSIKTQRFILNWKDILPCLDDKTKFTDFDHHYIYSCAWAARILVKNGPELHIDMSSNLFFVTIVSAFLKVDFYDFRPVNINIKNFTSGSADLLNLPFKDSSIDSISCLHVIEHIGLGRYGDTLDPTGDLKAMSELKRVIKCNGNILLVVPMGKPKIFFNAHRIYSYKQIIEYFKEFELMEFSLITDNKQYEDFIINANEKIADDQEYGCGCFWFRKIF